MKEKEVRRDYKAVWTGLSGSREDAHLYVSGHDDEETFHSAAEDTLSILMETVGVRETDTFLEIGCGVGRVGTVLSPFVKEWIGCDVSPNMLRHARRRLIGLENIRLQEVSGYDLRPIADASIDVVYTTVVFMHLEEWDRYSYVREAMRVLKPGGRFYCDNMNIASDEGWAVFEEGWRLVRSERPPQISKFSSVPEFETYLQRTGFIDIHVATRPMWVYGWGTKPPAGG
jgi:ubiquinone/menaquinone biosynthesis C-methylase UbiE